MIVIEFVLGAVLGFAVIALCAFIPLMLIFLIFSKIKKGKDDKPSNSSILNTINCSWLIGASIAYILYLATFHKDIAFADVMYNGVFGAICCLLVAFIAVIIIAQIINWIIEALNKWLSEHFETKKPIKEFLSSEFVRNFVVLYVASGAFVLMSADLL